MPNPYSYNFDSNSLIYQFTTKNQIAYSIAFIDDGTLNSISSIEIKNVYQVVIEKNSEELEPFDIQVFLTIDLIIRNFFKNIENALIYVCSNNDGKDELRFKTFSRWYNKSQQKEFICKVDNVLQFDEFDTIIYTSLLYHINHKNIEQIINTFKEIEKILNEDKE